MLRDGSACEEDKQVGCGLESEEVGGRCWPKQDSRVLVHAWSSGVPREERQINAEILYYDEAKKAPISEVNNCTGRILIQSLETTQTGLTHRNL